MPHCRSHLMLCKEARHYPLQYYLLLGGTQTQCVVHTRKQSSKSNIHSSSSGLTQSPSPFLEISIQDPQIWREIKADKKLVMNSEDWKKHMY